MALKLVKLDSQTLPDIADAIRAKTGETSLLLPSQMAAEIGSIKTLRMETGTIIPAQGSTALTLPYTGNPKALSVEATEEVEAMITANGVNAMLAVYGMLRTLLIGLPETLKTDIPLIAYMQVSSGTKVRGVVQMGPDGEISAQTNFPWVSGAEYRWTAYDWEDTL